MVKVIPSAFGLINWKEKLVVNDCTFTGVVKNTLDAWLDPPFVSSSCDAACFQLAFPFNCKPVVDVNPLEKLITAGLVLAVAGPSSKIGWVAIVTEVGELVSVTPLHVGAVAPRTTRLPQTSRKSTHESAPTV